MTVTLLARHPSPASGIPRRGRTERHGWEILATPVTLREADPSAFTPLPRPDTPDATYRDDLLHHGGKTWTVLGDHRPDGFRPFSRAEVTAFLTQGSHPDPALLDGLRHAFRFTPILAGGIVRDGTHYVHRARAPGEGTWHVDGASARLAHTERARSATGLQAWLDANLALSGEGVMIRRPVLVEIGDWGGRISVYLETVHAGAPHERIPVRPDLARAACAAIGLRYETGTEESLAAIEAWAEGLSTDDDLVRLANFLPVLLDADARSEAGTALYARQVRDPEAVEAALARLRPWVLRGAIGGIPREEAGDALARCLATIADLPEAGVRLNTAFKARADEIRARVLPRLVDLPPEDETALALTR